MTKLIIPTLVVATGYSFFWSQPPVEQRRPADVQRAKEVVAAQIAKMPMQQPKMDGRFVVIDTLAALTNSLTAQGTLRWTTYYMSIPRPVRAPTITEISDESLTKYFPRHVFFAARYRMFPVAEERPFGLAASNVFVVSDGKAEHLVAAEMLVRFFKDHGTLPAGDARQRALLRNWLLLSQEFVQDGFYRFEIDPAAQIEPLKNGAKRLSGRAVVMAGGNGEIKVSIELDSQDRVLNIGNSNQIIPGPRPICQATKLLDLDPVVRKMAEQDLLYMGLAARDYMMEQRDKATPELRTAIDLLWNQILQNGW